MKTPGEPRKCFLLCLKFYLNQAFTLSIKEKFPLLRARTGQEEREVIKCARVFHSLIIISNLLARILHLIYCSFPSIPHFPHPLLLLPLSSEFKLFHVSFTSCVLPQISQSGGREWAASFHSYILCHVRGGET